MITVLSVCACDSSHSVATNRKFEGEQLEQRWLLSSNEQSEIRSAFREAARGHDASQRPWGWSPPRWEDVPAAAYDACIETEMAIARTTKTDNSFEFDLRTVEGYSGTLLVTRTGDHRIYEATAAIGSLREHPKRAAELISNFEKQMRAYARKKRMR